MTSEFTGIEYRPLRIGFCVRNGNRADLVTTAKWNSLLWGGIYNPIIPVGDKTGLAKQLVNLFQVDVLLPVAEDPALKRFADEFPWLRWPLMHPNSLFSEDPFNKGKTRVDVLDISHIIGALWEKEFKFLDPKDSNCFAPFWLKSDKANEVLTLIFGAYPKKDFSFEYLKNYKAGLKAKDIKIAKDKNIPNRLSSAVTPIILTEQNMDSYGGSRHLGSGVFFGSKNSFGDLMHFWNIRAAGAFITFLPVELKSRFSSYIKKHIAQIKTAPIFRRDPEVTFWYSSLDDETVKKLRDAFKVKGKTDIGCRVSETNWNGLNIVPAYDFFRETTGLTSTDTRQGNPSVTIQLSGKPVQKTRRGRLNQQLLVASLNTRMGLQFPNHTTNLPVIPQLNEWYAREMMVGDPYRLRVEKNIIGRTVSVIIDSEDGALYINPVPKIDLIKKVFERAGIEAEISDAGLVAERLIARMGGDVMGNSRIFKVTGVRKYIDETRPDEQKTKEEMINKIRDKKPNTEENSFSKFENEFGVSGKMPLTPEDVFEVMLEKKLIKAGVEVRCPKCSLKTWLSLDEVSEYYTCEFCEEKSLFVHATKPLKKDGDGVDYSYRLSGLLGRSDNQLGAIPVILTLLEIFKFNHSMPDGQIYSTGLKMKFKEDGKEREIESDLAIFDLSERITKEDIEILIGECKTGNLITKETVEGLRVARELIQKSGIKCHLVFTKTKGDFKQSEISHFKKLVKDGINPILFTSKEIERWWNIYQDFEKTRKDFKLPHQHPFTFGELAANSVYIYRLRE